MITALEYEILDMAIDGDTPYAILFPEARRDIQADLDPAEFDRVVRSMANRKLVRLVVRDGGGVNPRAATVSDHQTIVGEYKNGERPSDHVRQIFDRLDIWIEISDAGRVIALAERP